ncbi:hypothetical protein EB118_00205 [bacterium]|jgi:hypothetical protein|nr:hypothetical protein [bacterium]
MKIKKLHTVSESITLYRYDNGWMVEVSGRGTNEYKTSKIMCATLEELIDVVKEWNSMELDN